MSTIYLPLIHLIMDFDGKLDAERLDRALRLCVQAEPILGYRYISHWWRPYWTKIPAEELAGMSFLRVEKGKSGAHSRVLADFLAQKHFPEKGPQIAVLLIPRKQGDRLVIKINHQVADTGGTKELAYRIAAFYRILKSRPDFQAPVNDGSRSLRQVYGRFGPLAWGSILRRYFIEMAGNLVPYKSMAYPSGEEKTGSPRFVFKRFGPDRVTALRSHGARTGATLNDIMLSAMLRALVTQTRWRGDRELRLVGTVDLRRYLPGGRGQAICNLSSFYFLNLGRELGRDFDDTLARVKAQIDGLKKDYLGLGFIFGAYLQTIFQPHVMTSFIVRRFFRHGVSMGNFPAAMTNLGPIDAQALDFGGPELGAAEIVVPVGLPPCFVVGLSGFRDTLTLSVGHYESAIPSGRLEELFDLVDRELPH